MFNRCCDLLLFLKYMYNIINLSKKKKKKKKKKKRKKGVSLRSHRN